MKKYCYTIITILFFGLLSCSNDETKTTNQIASRPTVPPTANEVQIGTQIWMTKNLNVSRYRNGDPIPQVTDPTQWGNLTTGAWCYYNNNPSNALVYGKLYNWYAVNDPRGLAPVGWHVPSNTEWTALTAFLGGDFTVGGKMKATGTSLWQSPNTDASNSSGFTGLPGGYRSGNTSFYYIRTVGGWWSSSEFNTASASNVYLGYSHSRIDAPTNNKRLGFSVRCVKD